MIIYVRHLYKAITHGDSKPLTNQTGPLRGPAEKHAVKSCWSCQPVNAMLSDGYQQLNVAVAWLMDPVSSCDASVLPGWRIKRGYLHVL